MPVTNAGDPSFSGSEPDADGFKPIVCGSKLVGGESGCTVKVEEEESKPVDGFKPIVCGSALVGCESGCIVKLEEEELKPEVKLSSSIEEAIRKVSSLGELQGGNSSSDESESESSSSSSSSSSISDNEEEEEEEKEEKKEKVKVEIKREVDSADELEEGEMAVDGTDDDDHDNDDDEQEEILSELGIEFDEDDDDDDSAVRGPIRSKNELEVLPPVPPLNVTLQPLNHMLPVGVVLSMIGTKVIVEGREQHNPLNEGSILWITVDRSPLGLVDEIFGPVKNPYYVVRYNSVSEIPVGTHEGTSISFVPEFANHVLNIKNLSRKGYDASGENDEELLDDMEFSDDEKEAEYKRMQKMTKRGLNDQRMGIQKSNKMKVKSRNGVWKNNRNSAQQTSMAVGQLPPNQNPHNFSSVSASMNNLNCSSSVVEAQSFFPTSGFIPSFSVMPQSSGTITPSNGVWTNGMPGQPPQNAVFPNMFSAESMPLISQNYLQQPIPLPSPAMSMPTMMPYPQQQLDPSPRMLPNTVLPGDQSSLFAGQACAPLLGISAQNGFSQTAFGMGLQGQLFLGALQSILTNGSMADGNCNFQPKDVQDNFKTSQNFNMGAASSSRGKKPYHRGRGHRFTGGRGRMQS